MADVAVRSSTPSADKRTPEGGAPTAPHTAAEAHEARIDQDAVTAALLGTWRETRLEARELLNDTFALGRLLAHLAVPAMVTPGQ